MKVEEIDVDNEVGEVSEILSQNEKTKGILIHVLQQIQEDMGYLPDEVLRKLSKKLNIPLSEIYSVASFYKMFHFKPRGKKVVRVCLGTACYVRGSKKVLNMLENEFGIKSGDTTEDLTMTLETVGCVGCCGLAPVATINDNVVGEIIGNKKLEKLIDDIRE
ncbi:MAG: NADH-quinone oxidoreductase subunit NuoE [Nitrospirae bacterium]|jgi:NADH-quinone oxidoreductase subunit E|nr:NADH-quinone oxidoreductase subunit NuoE [Nitrospirota bacterium]